VCVCADEFVIPSRAEACVAYVRNSVYIRVSVCLCVCVCMLMNLSPSSGDDDDRHMPRMCHDTHIHTCIHTYIHTQRLAYAEDLSPSSGDDDDSQVPRMYAHVEDDTHDNSVTQDQSQSESESPQRMHAHAHVSQSGNDDMLPVHEHAGLRLRHSALKRAEISGQTDSEGEHHVRAYTGNGANQAGNLENNSHRQEVPGSRTDSRSSKDRAKGSKQAFSESESGNTTTLPSVGTRANTSSSTRTKAVSRSEARTAASRADTAQHKLRAPTVFSQQRGLTSGQISDASRSMDHHVPQRVLAGVSEGGFEGVDGGLGSVDRGAHAR
jgi:hypothetical protein